MSKIFGVVFLIFGTVVGSGFSSGKEIMVFFSRFGWASYLYIVLAGILFFAIFYFFLRNGQRVCENLDASKWMSHISGIISLVFCASMFAGLKSLFSYFSTTTYFVLLAVLLGICFVVTFVGMNGLQKINVFLMPLTALVFLIVLVFEMKIKTTLTCSVSLLAGVLYSPLYVILNTSMSGFVIANAGKDLNKKQTLFVCLFSCLLLVFFMLLGNFVLQNNPQSFVSDMPFLLIAKQNQIVFWMEYAVILVGCFTTLISLMFTLKNSFQKWVESEKISTIMAVFLPLFVSCFGFSQIVSFLYPICSVLGILILLLSIFSFKKTDEIIHQKRQNTQNKGRRHD